MLMLLLKKNSSIAVKDSKNWFLDNQLAQAYQGHKV